MQQKLKIGEILVRTGMIQQAQLDAALGEQTRWGGRLGVTLVKMGMLEEDDLMRALGSHFGLPVVRLDGKKIAPEVLSLLPADFAEKHACLPLFVHWEGGQEVLYLGMEDPGDLAVLDDVSFRTGLRVKPVLVAPIQLRNGVQEFYHGVSVEDEDEDLPQMRPAPGKVPPAAVPPPAPRPAAAQAASPAPASGVELAEEESTQSFASSPGYDSGYEQTFDSLSASGMGLPKGAPKPKAPAPASPVQADGDPGASLGLGDSSVADPVLDPGASADAVLAAAASQALSPEASADGAFPVAPAAAAGPALVAEGDATVDPNSDTHSAPIQQPTSNPVPTRDILRAVTQLLIEAGIFSREQLVEKLRHVRSDRRSGDA